MCPPAEGSSKFYALLVAIDCYLPNRLREGYYPSLRGCVRDVRNVEDFLKRRLSLKADHLLKLTSTNTGSTEPPEPSEQRPTYENMVRAFKAVLDRARSGDQVYIHYSGHGGRTPTIVPDVKGSQALDEALVPMDIGNSSSRYLRDVELAKLFSEMVAKGLFVTVVMDCCHSGGLSRGPGAAVRGVQFVDRTARPNDSLVAPVEQLGASWHDQTGGSGCWTSARALVVPAPPVRYVLLAACQPSEVAYEYPFDGKENNGALTYWLLDSLEEIGPGLTYKVVYDLLLPRIHGQFVRQTPLLLGDAARTVFGTSRVEPQFAATVMAVDTSKRLVTIGTGQAAGIRRGAQFVIYPRGTTDLTRTDTRTASVQISDLGAVESKAEIVQTFGPRMPASGDQAVLVGAGAIHLVRKVRLMRANGTTATDDDAAFLDVKKALPGNGWLELVEGPDTPADFNLAISGDGQAYEICDKAGQPLNVRPALAIGDKGSPMAVVTRLVHLAKYRAVQELNNNDAASPLRGRLVIELLGVQDQFDPMDKPQPRPFPPGIAPTLKVGQWTFLQIKNLSSNVLNVSVLDLQPDWGITLYPPPGGNMMGFEPLDPGGEPLVLPLQGSLPDGYEDGLDIIKVIATLGPTSFRTLTLPTLDLPIPQMKGRAAGDALDQLVAAIAADQPPLRTLTSSMSPTREWTVSQLEIRIKP